jgi:hypothetical protein
MLKIDNSLLQDIGLGSLPDDEKNGLLKHIYETLEMRVGMRLADQMSNEQLDEFEQYFEAKDDAGAFKWLETNFPNYKDIVQEEFDKLKIEVSQSAPQILGASQQQTAGAINEPPQQQPVQQPAPQQPQPQAWVPAPAQPQPQPFAPAPQFDPQQQPPYTPPPFQQPQAPQFTPPPQQYPNPPQQQPQPPINPGFQAPPEQ